MNKKINLQYSEENRPFYQKHQSKSNSSLDKTLESLEAQLLDLDEIVHLETDFNLDHSKLSKLEKAEAEGITIEKILNNNTGIAVDRSPLYTTISILLSIENLQNKAIKFFVSQESQAHFEELSEDIRQSEKNSKIAQLKIWRLLILEMWLEEKFSGKIWLPYVSKLWLFVETQIIGAFSRF